MATATPSTNVVRLPTAARRQVAQRWNKETRPVAKALRQQWPGQYIAPHVRAQMADAEALLDLTRSPELCIALSIFETLDDPARAKVRTHVEIMALSSTSARGAAAILRRRTIGDQIDLDAALAILRGEG